jgi:hypothetical protein
MPARLSSLLVRDGLVGVKRMEKAFQRQVIYGGSLDTILLEMSLLTEERLTQYLALASGLPPASRDEGSNIDDKALGLISSEIAAQFRAVPLSIDGEALRVLVCSPLQINELEDLADLLDRPLQPLITPEYRWHLLYARAYRVDAPARFTTLARQQESGVVDAPVGRARSVIVDDAGATVRPTLVTDPDATQPLTQAHPAMSPPPRPKLPRAPSDPSMADLDDTTERIIMTPVPLLTPDRSRTSTLMGVTPSRSEPDSGSMMGTGIPARPPASVSTPPSTSSTNMVTPLPVRTPATPSTGVPRAIDSLGSAEARSGAEGRRGGVIESIRGQSAANRPAMPRTMMEPIATAGRDSPLAVVRARELLATAEDRDTVFLTLLRAARARSRYAGLLTVQGGAAIGRVALAEGAIDTAAIAKVLIPLDVVSPFRAVTQNQQPHIGPIVTGDPGIDSMLLRLGGTLPPSALLMPIVLRNRVVAVVVAHRVHSDLKLVDVTEMLPLASGAADALGRLIVKHKSAGYRAPASSAPNIPIEAAHIDTKKIVTKDAGWRAPGPAERPTLPSLDDGPDLEITTDPPRSIAVVLDTIETGSEGTVDDSIADAVERAPETIGELAKRFPGKLRVDRFAVAGRPLRAAQYGGLLELVVRLGTVASELIIDRMGSPQRDVRFYAAVCAAELRPRNAVFALVDRLFDQDYGVRGVAIEALSGYAVGDLTHALARARRAVHSSDPETVVAATAALVQLGDVDAIDDLIGAVERGDRAGEHARKALVSLTAQDFGLSEKKWRKWHETARKRHRIEWLIEGLVHKEDAIREIAINDLRRLTGEYFGYHHDLPRKERDVAAERWSSWWRETGMRRFVHREDERHRPTAVLPLRKE